ncbi:MAG: hypothetical protein TV42_05625 [Wolbachia endosymbiont of Dactylopius coccus]|nr:MAG: hypothetical protein TV42_05625 [Wolbachia endosymbiont of Dactylopius coccus]
MRDQSGKTPLHYAAKNNCLQARELLLGAGANPNVQDQSGKTPSEYATEDECRQAIEDSSHSSDDSHENKGNPATPDSSVGERNDCSNSSGDDSQAKPAEVIVTQKLKDQGYGSDGSCENEENPAKSPNNENWTPTDQQTSSESLEVSNSSESEDSEDSSDCDNRDNNISRLNNLAYESIVNKNNKQTHEYDFKAKINDGHFCIEYPQNNIIEPVKILNNEKAKELKLKVGILQIGENIVRVKGTKDGKRNYTDILGSIEMSFTTEAGEISIYLSPSKKDGNKIKIEIDEENKAKFNKLKDKSSLGENCLLGGKNVLKAIEDKGFEKNGSVPTESTETLKDALSTNLTQVRLQQNREVALGVSVQGSG